MRRLLLLLLLTASSVSAQQIRIPVENWTVRSENGRIGPIAALVPGVVHTALHDAGLIPDPYFGDNEQRVAWVDTTTWVYETRIHIPASMEQPILVFEGLDTIADVCIDSTRVLRADNMFRRWEVSLGSEFAGTEFALKIVFHPAAPEAERLAAEYPYPLPESPRMFVRKAAYHFGWDWGPRFLTAGPWKGVFLEDAAIPRLEGTYLRTLSISDDVAEVELVTSLRNAVTESAEIVVSLNGNEMVRTSVDGVADEEIRIPFEVSNPRLWWPGSSDPANLYDLDIEVAIDGRTIHERQRAGIRTVELDQTDGAFTFVINGEPIFAKGANSAPMTSFYPASAERYRTVLQSAADANMNMIRVWGGGVYEDDLFYDLADSLGIMVWQDFMFANALYPETEEFLANVRQEAGKQVARLRRHPSIVLWCGNNEISEGWHNWGWQESLGYSEADSLALWQGYQRLFEELLPSVVEEFQPDVPYWPSSPSNGWGRDIAYEQGDVHYWGVWWGRAPFESYREKIGRFNSEYGFQAYPVEATVRTFADDLPPDSEEFRNHQKHPHGEEWLREYALMTFGHVPEDPGLWRYMTQVMQAEGVGMAIAGHRASKPRTMGTLYWQLNDVWPVVSWSSMDVFGRWKPLHYRVRELYQPLFAEVYQEGDSLRLRVVSDSMRTYAGQVTIEAFDTLSGILGMDAIELTITANGVVDVPLKPRDAFEITDDRLVFRSVLYLGTNLGLSRNTSTLVPRWQLNIRDPELDVSIDDESDVVWISSKYPAFGVWLEDTAHGINMPLNYQDVFPSMNVFEGMFRPASLSADSITIRSLYDLQQH